MPYCYMLCWGFKSSEHGVFHGLKRQLCTGSLCIEFNNVLQHLNLLPEHSHSILVHFLMHLSLPVPLLQHLTSPFLVLHPAFGHPAPPITCSRSAAVADWRISENISSSVLHFLCLIWVRHSAGMEGAPLRVITAETADENRYIVRLAAGRER